jgi:hypothetical protein
MKNAVFWDVAPCRSCVNPRFGGACRFHLQGRKIRERGTSLSRWLSLVLDLQSECEFNALLNLTRSKWVERRQPEALFHIRL